MKKILFFLSLVPISLFSFSQEKEIIQKGTDGNLAEKVSYNMQYVFPEFTDGVVFHKANGKIDAKLNYNMLLGEMQFIAPDSNVLTLDDLRNIVVVTIENRNFYPFNNNEFTEVLVSKGKTGLQVRRKATAKSHSKQGAYGAQSSVAKITPYTSMEFDGVTYKLKTAENILVDVNSTFYMINENGKRVLIKNLKTFTRQFSKFETQIDTFVKEHDTNFNKEEDLIALVEYCNELLIQ